MDRGWVLLALARFQALATNVGLTLDDEDTGLGPAVDDALLMVGAAPGTLMAPDLSAAQWADARALVRYYGLRLLAEQLALRVDVEVGAPLVRTAESQQFKQVLALMQDARKDIEQRGYGPNTITSGTYQLDIFEPLQGTYSGGGGGLGWW